MQSCSKDSSKHAVQKDFPIHTYQQFNSTSGLIKKQVALNSSIVSMTTPLLEDMLNDQLLIVWQCLPKSK